MKYGRKYAQDLQPFQMKRLQQHYGRWYEQLWPFEPLWDTFEWP